MTKQDKEFFNRFRCLRMHLTPLMTAENLATLEEAERRLEKSGAVSTIPAKLPQKKTRGKCATKQELFNKYYYK
jgi:hypothetical protein